jgi:hypothetical protein
VANSRYEGDNYVIDIQNYSATARFQLLSPFRKLHFGLNYSTQNVDFYDMDPNFALEYAYFKEINPTVYLTYLRLADEGGPWRQEDNIDTRGTYFKLKYDYLHDSLLVDGSSFQQSFEISNSGILHPRYRFDRHQRLKLDFRHERDFPFLPLVTVGGEAMATVADRPTDNFAYPGVFMKSYPFLADQAHLFFLGRNAARGELNLRFPIVRRLRKGLGAILFDKIYGMAFIEGGVSAGIDPTEDGRSDLDSYSREGRRVDHYMARLQTSAENSRQRVTAATPREMDSLINVFTQGLPGYRFDERDRHTVYERLPEDTMTGFAQNFRMLFNAPVRVGFGTELRIENYIVPGYPFFVTVRYSHTLNRDDPAASLKDYFSHSPFNSRESFFYLNAGFSFDNWESIDVGSAHHPGRGGSRY